MGTKIEKSILQHSVQELSGNGNGMVQNMPHVNSLNILIRGENTVAKANISDNNLTVFLQILL